MLIQILESSLTGLTRLILIILVVYAAYSLTIRFIIPNLMKKYISSFQKHFFEENPNFRQGTEQHKKEGEVSIKFTEKDKKDKRHESNGDYVDYEEIK